VQQTAEKAKTKIPPEAVELYTQFIHGEISRRDFMDTVGRRFAVAGVTTAAIIEALMPNYALGQQVRRDDERIKATYETIPSPSGNGYIRGYFVRPFSQDTRSRRNCPPFSSSTRIAGSIRTPRTLPGGSRSRTSWHLRPTR
jgi:carboxymethylenebutenolidase